MSILFTRGTPVEIVDNLGYRSSQGFNNFFYQGKIKDCPLGIKGIVTAATEKVVRVKFSNGVQWHFHPDEIDFSDEYTSALQDIANLPSADYHPLLHLAKDLPLFIIGKKVYVSENTKDTQDYFQTRAWLGYLKKKVSLTSLDSLESLDKLFLVRTAKCQERLSEEYEKKVFEKIEGLLKKPKERNISQKIYFEILPYLRTDISEKNIESILELELQEREKELNPETNLKDDPKDDLKDSLENDKENDQKGKKGKNTKNLKKKKERINENEEKGREIKPYDTSLIASEIEMISSQIEKRISFMKQRLEVKKEKKINRTKQEEELDTLLGYAKKETEDFTYTRSPFIDALNGRDIAFVNKKIYLLHTDENLPKKGLSVISEKKHYISKEQIQLADLEEAILTSLSQKIRLTVLEKRFSSTEIKKLIQRDDVKELVLSGKGEHQEGEGGFIFYNNNYYAFIQIPSFVLKSQFDKRSYFFEKTRAAILIEEKNGKLTSGNGFYMIDNNNHPFLHHVSGDFAPICIGDQAFPTKGKTRGEIVSSRLRRIREVLLYGYTSNSYKCCFELRTRCHECGRDHFRKNRMQEPITDKNILVIQGGQRK